MADPVPGAELGRYQVTERIGEGGMGAVFRGRDPALGRDVAIKLVSREHQRKDGAVAEARLIREGQALAQLAHPNVVRIYDVGRSDQGVFVAMELVEGRPLGAWVADARPSWRAVVSAYRQAGEGLHAGHALGIVHRDFKPSNVMIDDHGRVRVLDFGLARLRTDARQTVSIDGGPVRGAANLLSTELTNDGSVLGTPLYMAPEQHHGERATPLSDQFSFCLSVFEALSGSYPYDRTSIATLASSKGHRPQHPPRSGVPAEVWRVLLRGMASEPDARWPSMRAGLDALELACRRGRRRWIASGAAAVAFIFAGVGAWPSREGPNCSGGAELDRQWNGPRIHVMQSAFVEAAPTIGSTQWGNVRERVDAWAERWSGAHQRACEEARSGRSTPAELLDRRMACLRGQTDELGALLEAFESAHVDSVAQSLTAVATLPDPDACLGAAAAELDGIQPELLGPVEEVRAYLRRSQAAYHTARPDRALQYARDAVERARSLAVSWLLCDALIQRGAQLRTTGDSNAAIEDYTEAYFLALERGDARRQAQAASRLTFAHAQRQRRDEALAWAEHTRAATRRSDDLGWFEIVVLHALGDLERRSGRHNEALAAYGEALGRASENPGELGPLDQIRLRQSRGNVLSELGRYDEAIEVLRAAVDQARDVGGQHHPTVGTGMSALGIALWYSGQAKEAAEVFGQAQEHARSLYGDGHPGVVGAMVNRAGALVDAEQPAHALELYERAETLLAGTEGESQDRVARLLGGKGRALSRLGRLDEAADAHRSALEIRRATLRDGHPSLGIGLVNLGVVEHKRGAAMAAERHLSEALSIFEQAFGAAHPRTLVTRAALGKVLVSQGRTDDALRATSEAAATADQIEMDPAERADIAFAHAQATWATGNRTAALAMVDALREELRSLGPAGREVERELNAWWEDAVR